MGGFLGIGNSSAKTDRGNQLAGINAEWNIYNRGLPLSDKSQAAGQATTGAGMTSMDEAKKYWSDIMTGNKPAAMQAASPAIDAVNTEADAQRTQQGEMGTARGGGVASNNQKAEFERLGKANDIIAGQQPMAAKSIQEIGTAQASVGNQQVMNALRELGLSEDVANEIINSSVSSRPISMKANAEVRQQWSNALAALGL